MVILGCGSFGVVLAKPRIPLDNERLDDIVDKNQVSKLLYTRDSKGIYHPAEHDEFDFEYTNVLELANKYPNVFSPNYFMIPINGGPINKEKFCFEFTNNERYNYRSWLGGSRNNYKIIHNLITSPKELYQVIFDRGEKVSSNTHEFLTRIINVKNALDIAFLNGFYFDDIKLENLITHDNTIKIIDFSLPINLGFSDNNESELEDNFTEKFSKCVEQIAESKLNHIYYYPYDVVSNLLLFDYIERMDLIGKIGKIGTSETGKNYYSLMYIMSEKFHSNISYRMKMFKNLLLVGDKYLHDYSTQIKLFDLKLLNMVENEEDVLRLSEYKTINLDDFTYYNLRIMTFDTDNYGEYTHNENIINNMIMYYHQYIEKIYRQDKLKKINFLLKNINSYSFGFVIVSWLYENMGHSYIRFTEDLSKLFDIIIMSCTNVIILNENFYLRI